MKLIFHALEHAFEDSLPMLPFLFLAYLLIEWIERHHGDAIERALAGGGRWGFVPGAVLGCVPQCGFSALAANLYASRVITPGTLLAVFVATSDEALPLLAAAPGVWNTLPVLLGAKVAAGVAAGLRLDFPERPPRVYAITGDGELAEGQIWEALLSAAVYRLDNLRVVVDQNGLQATGPTKERFPIPHLEEKFRAFGFAVFTVDGHNVREILEALQKAEEVRGKPVAIVAQTVKGKGISFAENQPSFHNGAMTREQYETALRELEEKAGEAL